MFGGVTRANYYYGFSFEQAHAILGSIVGEVTDTNQSIDDIHPDIVQRITQEITGKDIVISEAEIREALDPWTNICRKKTPGSPNEERVKAMITDLERIIEEEKNWIREKKQHVADALSELDKECSEL